MVGEGEQRVDLLDILRTARRPHDEAKEREEAQRREEETQRERLRSDPEALAERLRESFATPGETISWAERRPMPFASQSKARAG